MLESQSYVEGDIGCQVDTEKDHRRPLTTQNGENHNERQTKCISVQTENNKKQDAETVTDEDTEQILKQLISCREQLKNSYQEVLDRQTQSEKQLQVQIKQLKQKRDEEIQRHKENFKSIQDVTTKREEARKRVEKEGRELSQKEQDLTAELAKLQSKNDSLNQEQSELESSILELITEQTAEREEWDAELASLKKKENEVTQGALKELERAQKSEILSLESRRDLLLISLDEAEKDAEVTLSYLRVAPPHKEWIQLKQRWEARLAGIKQMKANLREQFDVQIKQVQSGTKLNNLPSILAPNLPPPPSDPNLMLQKIAFATPTISTPSPAPIPPKDHAFQQQQLRGPASFHHLHPPLLAFPPGNFMGPLQMAQRLPGISALHSSTDVPGPPSTDKLGKILEKLHARFPHYNKAQLTDILQQVKMKRGTLSGLTVEELCHLVATQLQEQIRRESSNLALKVTQPIGHGRPQYQNTQRAAQFLPPFLPPATRLFAARPQLCLICQKNVQPHELQPKSCNHVMHIECIRFWAIANKNSSCPFCPSHR